MFRVRGVFLLRCWKSAHSKSGLKVVSLQGPFLSQASPKQVTRISKQLPAAQTASRRAKAAVGLRVRDYTVEDI